MISPDSRSDTSPLVTPIMRAIFEELRSHLTMLICQQCPPGTERDARLAVLEELIERNSRELRTLPAVGQNPPMSKRKNAER